MLQGKVQDMDFPPMPSQQIGDHLAAGLVYDLPEAMQGISQEQLDEWGVTFYEAMEAARENLAGMEYQVAAVSDLVYMFATGDSYDASRLLLLDVVRKFGVDGDYIVMVPNRDTLLITGSNEDGGLAIMAAQAEKALESHHPLCAIPMRLVGDEWETWMPERDDPLYQKFKLLAIKSMGSEYSEQKELLEQLHEQTGEDLHVASYSAVEHETDGYQTYCVWSEGVDSLLPKTDLVFFYRGDDGEDGDIPTQVEWDQVQAQFGDLMEPQDMYPPRFRVREFPGEERFDDIMDRIVNGWYQQHKRIDRWSDQHCGLVVWLEWVQIYGESPSGKNPGVGHGQTVEAAAGSGAFGIKPPPDSPPEGLMV